MSEMIERVARSIKDCEAWSSFWGDEEARKLARAAIQAMREPTNEMFAAGARDRPPASLRLIWEDMIDQALEVRS